MDCHDNKNGNHKSHSSLKHMLHMVICCAVPILIVAALPFLKLNIALKTTILSIAPFICPIMMIFMIPMMLKAMRGEHSHNKHIEDSSSVINENKEENTIKSSHKNTM
ncbi:hypothetical protein [Clostridium sp. DJ247]|uniref:hypothetical protein n=1 Tax=Clostridium sp. DJ247 TaxID=2726188 RepID=UPI0016259F80|nr:hypothetical protein [Clostridium sp. DJ247]MBC2582052.1 hypothetical protein [Clostridium sp. DJ247]